MDSAQVVEITERLELLCQRTGDVEKVLNSLVVVVGAQLERIAESLQTIAVEAESQQTCPSCHHRWREHSLPPQDVCRLCGCTEMPF